jgi:GTPase SAR1 family protein
MIPEDSRTVFDTWRFPWQVNDEEVTLELWDTSPCEDLENIRVLSYPRTDVFLVLFSVVWPGSFWDVSCRWVPEIKKYFKRPRVILVGTQTDLREDGPTLLRLSQEGRQAIQPAQGWRMAKTIKAFAYMEFSKMEQDRMNKVFDLAVRTAMTPETMRRRLLRRWAPWTDVQGVDPERFWNHRELNRRWLEAAAQRDVMRTRQSGAITSLQL